MKRQEILLLGIAASLRELASDIESGAYRDADYAAAAMIREKPRRAGQEWKEFESIGHTLTLRLYRK